MKWAAALLFLALGLSFAAIAVSKRASPDAAGNGDTSGVRPPERERTRRFWETYRRATGLRIAGRSADAAEEYARALALRPTHQDALYYLGNMEFDRGDPAAAERAWRRLVEVDPTNARGHSQLGLLYSCVGEPAFLRLEEAAAEFRRALTINREETGPLLHLGEIALIRDDLEQARAYFDQVAGSNASSVEAHFYRGYLAWKAGAESRAAENLAAAAAHARPASPVRAVPGEGDTRAGSEPMVTSSHRCRPMRAWMIAIAGLDAGTATPRVGPVYGAFDARLREMRRHVLP